MTRRYRNAVGPQVRRFRTALGFTQEQLAGKLNLAGLHEMNRLTVVKIEGQIRSVFDYELAIVAKVLGTTCDELLPAKAALARDLDDLVQGVRGR